jgi:hypothetical protein
MGRPAKGLRLHKYSHRKAWYTLDAGRAAKSTGTECFGQAVRIMRDTAAREAMNIKPAAIETDAALMTAVRKVIRKSRERAKLKGYEFDLTESNVLQMIAEQGGRCALTGIEFSVETSTEGRRMPFAPSADRIDNRKGYTADNLRMVCAIANLARGDFSDAEFITMCRGVALKNWQ